MTRTVHREEVEEFDGITKGTPSDSVLDHKFYHRSQMVMEPKIIGADADGLIVEWHYSHVIFTMKMAKETLADGKEVMRYAVQKIEKRVEKWT